jgi:hypothetical protein
MVKSAMLLRGVTTFVLALTLMACASVQMSDGAKRVRIVTSSSASPSGCKYLGEVRGDEYGESVKPGLRLATFGSAAEERARIDLKNQAAKMGANVVQVMNSTEDNEIMAEAYSCPN